MLHQTLPKRWEPFMREEDLIPPPSKTFPRSAWRNGVFLIPPFDDDFPGHDKTRLHWAARNASTEWAESVAMGHHVDRQCFILAVIDKILEDQRRLLGFEPRLPTYAEWRQHTNDLIRKWYWIGFHRLPSGSPDPPSFRETHAAVRAAITSLYCRGVDADAAPTGSPPRYDRDLLGRFDPNVREPPPLVRYVQPLQFHDCDLPPSHLDPNLEAMSEARRHKGGQKMNIVQTVTLPPVRVDMVDVETPCHYGPASPRGSQARMVSSTESSDTEVAPRTPIASAETSPQSKDARKI
ncbi:hypothetical protein A1Q2_00676 [Trichosporon asahii var. asahii CBS 8904]|uniref:Uncharacterized protein n=1 Tax=Trichosporon asahii var. asahii (strain CBS 8904) TaxID=1220162 RepID=K1VZP1_TRIAC|nr:hypothetical protein A1Q2_00676 [Trichosporon asahii var. asahii CBS 8904]